MVGLRFFYYKFYMQLFQLKHLQNYKYSHNLKDQKPKFHKFFTNFSLWEWIEARITLFRMFFVLSVSSNKLLKSNNHEICEIRPLIFLKLWEYVWFDRCSSFFFFRKNCGPKFWHHSGHSTMSQCRKIASQRPKYANLVQAGTSAYETVGNKRVKQLQLISWNFNMLRSFFRFRFNEKSSITSQNSRRWEGIKMIRKIRLDLRLGTDNCGFPYV